MKKLFKTAYVSFHRFLQRQRWKKESATERNKIRRKDTRFLFKEGVKMILAPHVDDEWIGCSQVLSKENGVHLVYADMPGGDSLDVHKLRYEELNYVSNSNHCQLSVLKDDKVEGLRKLIVDIRPAYIFIPFFIDWHDEHIEVMKILKQALQKLKGGEKLKIVGYQVSMPIRSDYVTHTLPLTKEQWHEKWKQFAYYYPSQRHIPASRFALQEYVNGAICDTYAAEVFVEMDSEKWIVQYEKLILPPFKRDFAKGKLSSITNLRLFINGM